MNLVLNVRFLHQPVLIGSNSRVSCAYKFNKISITAVKREIFQLRLSDEVINKSSSGYDRAEPERRKRSANSSRRSHEMEHFRHEIIIPIIS